MGSIKAFTPLALMENILITGNSTVQRFNLRSKRMWRVGIRQAGLSLWHCGLMDALWLKEKGLPLPPHAQSFTPSNSHWFPLLTSGHWLEIELEIVGNRGLLFLVLVAFIFFSSPPSPILTNPPFPNYHPFPVPAFQQTAEELMGIAVTVRTHLNDCADFASSNNGVLRSERLRSPLRF